MNFIGILALQGNYAAHCALLRQLGEEPLLIRQREELARCRALIIPGGESTVMGALLQSSSMMETLQRRIRQGLPTYGVCAGAILLARTIKHSHQPHLGTIDIEVERNAYGRQVHSHLSRLRLTTPFVKELTATVDVASIPAELLGLFIRAPKICSWGKEVVPLAYMGNDVVAVRHSAMLVTTFHPEMSGIDIFHRYFSHFSFSSS